MKRWLPVVMRMIIGAIFVWAGASKAWDPTVFVQAVGGYQLLPYPGAVMLALYLPGVEIICGASLILGRLKSGSLAVLSVLLFVFVAALLSAWWRGSDIACGCFSQAVGTGYLWPISRNLMLLSGLFYLALQRSVPREGLVSAA